MAEQIIISISREFGSAGHEVAEKIAADFGFELYDKGILNEVAKANGVSEEELNRYDEKPKNPLWVRKVGDFTNSNEEHIANMQFDFIKEKAASGESFVIVGRCADSVLAGTQGLVTVFVTGDYKEKLLHIMTKFGIGEDEAKEKMVKSDKRRKQYHSDYSKLEWGDIHSYDLTVNSSKLGVDKTAKLIEDYVKSRFE